MTERRLEQDQVLLFFYYYYSCTAHSYVFVSHARTYTHTHICAHTYTRTHSHALPWSWRQPGTVFPQPPSANVVTLAGLQSRRALLIHHVSEDVCVRANACLLGYMDQVSSVCLLLHRRCGRRLCLEHRQAPTRCAVYGRISLHVQHLLLP